MLDVRRQSPTSEHPGELLRDPWSRELAVIDAALVPLIRALWASGIRTVASCQNVGEFAWGTLPGQAQVMVRSRRPLHHANTITHGLGYVRVAVRWRGLCGRFGVVVGHLASRRVDVFRTEHLTVAMHRAA